MSDEQPPQPPDQPPPPGGGAAAPPPAPSPAPTDPQPSASGGGWYGLSSGLRTLIILGITAGIGIGGAVLGSALGDDDEGPGPAAVAPDDLDEFGDVEGLEGLEGLEDLEGLEGLEDLEEFQDLIEQFEGLEDFEDFTPPESTGADDEVVAFGDSAPVATEDDLWTVEVVDVAPDAADQVDGEPESGNQFVMIRLHLTVTETGPDGVAEPFDLFLAGEAGQRLYLPDSDCPGFPEPIEPFTELSEGEELEGNICREVRSADVEALVLVAGDIGGERVRFALS